MKEEENSDVFGSVDRIIHCENLNGKDYVVGDLHGSFDLLAKFMDQVKFNKETDRLFSVGDLIDRGSQSMDCLRLIKEHWFYPCTGNHEQMLHAFMNLPSYDLYHRSFITNGGDWAYTICMSEDSVAKELKELSILLESLPRMRSILGKNKVHIVHAELCPFDEKTDVTDNDIEDPKKLSKMLRSPTWDGDSSFWRRTQFSDFYNNKKPENVRHREKTFLFDSEDLSLIISGHTIVRQPILKGRLLNIDTCAYQPDGALTSYCVTDGIIRQTLRSEEEIKIVQPFVMNI